MHLDTVRTAASTSRSPRPARRAPRGNGPSLARRGAAGLTALAVAGALTACQIDLDPEQADPGSGPPSPGAPPGRGSMGDPYVPGNGNGGYDVQHYNLKLAITPGSDTELIGTATINAKATRKLSGFNLDLAGLKVAQVTVDGKDAKFRQDGEELVIDPARAVNKDAKFQVAVRYSGTPQPVDDPILGSYGWIRTPDGVFVACQPSGAHTWFPSNDHPSDKATFDFEITVPAELTAIANGVPAAQAGGGTAPTTAPTPSEVPTTGPPPTGPPTGGTAPVVPAAYKAGKRKVSRWRVTSPMSTYLATVNVGRFGVKTGKTPGGITNITAVDPDVMGLGLEQFYALNSRITDEFAKYFGPYPFTSTGGLVDNAQVGFALETQTRPVYGSFGASEGIVAHELAHQWFGDSVGVTRWRDIWLNEGFATYGEWMWEQMAGGETVQAKFERLYSDPGSAKLWAVPPGNPGRKQMFHPTVYDRGAMTLHALRSKVGDGTFFEILRTWTKEHRHSNATTEQFVQTAERVSGTQLDALFKAWLQDTGRPPR